MDGVVPRNLPRASVAAHEGSQQPPVHADGGDEQGELEGVHEVEEGGGEDQQIELERDNDE